MKIWRVVRAGYTALDGNGAALHGGRYSPPGYRVVPFASEAGLAVLVALRYLPSKREEWPDDFVLGWTDVSALPERVDEEDEALVRQRVQNWHDTRSSLLISVPSRVLPEADIVLMNPLHPDFENVDPLCIRPFSFEACLHRPPMLDNYQSR